MACEATINARLPESLKQGGSAVLKQQGVSPTQLIRSLYSYMESEGKIPECLVVSSNQEAELQRERMQVAHSVAGSIELPADFNMARIRDERIRGKYGDLL